MFINAVTYRTARSRARPSGSELGSQSRFGIVLPACTRSQTAIPTPIPMPIPTDKNTLRGRIARKNRSLYLRNRVPRRYRLTMTSLPVLGLPAPGRIILAMCSLCLESGRAGIQHGRLSAAPTSSHRSGHEPQKQALCARQVCRHKRPAPADGPPVGASTGSFIMPAMYLSYQSFPS